ncbi:PH domain-containing protein [Flavobacterium selenitireducens]|uniref:PH domain-containing protein n=1 Tax=Flavobacterium selenitireducens TaxID=2722704 RepID=UPI00168B3328|nr:PH domain-containing protein [Flavobacterium selenitireducens]MBD3582517.1 PH domain-containing protein [Flavobacterium selenitireducens]
MMRFRSKIGIELLVIVGVAVGATAYGFIEDHTVIGLVLISVFAAYFLYMAANTSYWIEGGLLHIRCGLWRRKIDVSRIHRIETSRNLVSSPAMSLDRLEIYYDKMNSVVISPKDKIGFVKALKNAQPNLEIRVKGWDMATV